MKKKSAFDDKIYFHGTKIRIITKNPFNSAIQCSIKSAYVFTETTRHPESEKWKKYLLLLWLSITKSLELALDPLLIATKLDFCFFRTPGWLKWKWSSTSFALKNELIISEIDRPIYKIPAVTENQKLGPNCGVSK